MTNEIKKYREIYSKISFGKKLKLSDNSISDSIELTKKRVKDHQNIDNEIIKNLITRERYLEKFQ